MRTDDLIAHLSTELQPVKSGALGRLLITALAIGIATSTVAMLMIMGLRPDFSAAMVSFGMWIKLVYTSVIAAFGFWFVQRAGRPGADLTKPIHMLAFPLLAIVLLSALQMAQPGADVHGLVVGHSADVCPWNIVTVAVPTLLATLWGLRSLAPTRLELAGAGAGLFAGAAGAFVYAFHCTEASAPFVAVWYSLGIALTTGVGAFLGRWALRW